MTQLQRLSCDYPECPAFMEWQEGAIGVIPSRLGWRYASTYGDLCPTHAKEVRT